MPDIKDLRREADRLDLPLTDEDLEVIAGHVEGNRSGIRKLRPEMTDGLEPPYVFTPISPEPDTE